MGSELATVCLRGEFGYMAKGLKPNILTLTLSLAVSGCETLLGVPLRPAECFGDVPYSFAGWTTSAQLGPVGPEGPPGGRVFAMITRDEVVLTHSPVAPDGSSIALVGRGVCWTGGDGSVSRASFGPTRQEPDPRP